MTAAAPIAAGRVIVLGAGRHGRVCVETLQLVGRHRVLGYLDDDVALHDVSIDGLPVLGSLARLQDFAENREADAAVVGTANLRILEARQRIYETAVGLGFTMIAVVHPSAFLSPSSTHGGGLFLAPMSAVGRGCHIGNNVCMYSGTTIDHDNSIGDHVFIGPGVHTAGMVTIGSSAYLGPGVVVAAGCSVGEGTIVAAGAAVTKNLPARVVAFGTPARARETTASWFERKGWA